MHSKFCLAIIESFLEKHKEHAQLLADVTDSVGRKAIDVALPRVKEAIQQRILFCGRYRLDKRAAVHRSKTCKVVMAEDTKVLDSDGKPKRVRHGTAHLLESISSGLFAFDLPMPSGGHVPAGGAEDDEHRRRLLLRDQLTLGEELGPWRGTEHDISAKNVVHPGNILTTPYLQTTTGCGVFQRVFSLDCFKLSA